MAGIEQLEVHSKSYIVRWVKVDEGHTISWSVQPHKKSINFGIVKHPGSGGTNLSAIQLDDFNASNSQTSVSDGKTGRFSKRDASTAQDQLANKGFIPIKWHGKCEADKVSMGTYNVVDGQGGMFGLVFDNTFSKQTSKTATFVLLTYPTDAPPQGTHHLPNIGSSSMANVSRTSLGRHQSPHLKAIPNESLDSLQSHPAGVQRGTSVSGRSDAGTPTYHVGTLHKRRRKKGQGYARRFFSLDFSSCTLSYYHNRNSSALRGAIPLSLAAIAADEPRREISIDSGAEIWHLKAANPKEFTEWARALERASRIARGLETAPERAGQLRVDTAGVTRAPRALNMDEEREWQEVEALVSRIVGTRDALRRLVKDTANQPPAPNVVPHPPLEPSPGDGPVQERRPFWKRKPSSATLGAQAQTPPPSTLAVPSSTPVTAANGTSHHAKTKSRNEGHDERSMHDHCAALLTDLDSVVADFTKLVTGSKRRRRVAPLSAVDSRRSMETVSTEEFFDAEAGDTGSQIVRIARDDDVVPESEEEFGSFRDNESSASSVDEDEMMGQDHAYQLFPPRFKTLPPFPLANTVQRRTTIPPATVPPPSLIAFVRKNVGKDMSTISMPASANEPTSLLQKFAEQLEYADLLDQAAKAKLVKDRLLYVTAFAISQLSSGRAKERAIRKPFNPLLGETYELVRTENEVPGGFRLLVEKISHRPVRLAMQADSFLWSFTQAPAPSQNFWGKSAEILVEGRVRIVLRLADGTDEFYSWNTATVLLKNVVMGEKYVEPVGDMSVSNETTGARANVEFRSKGMFGGRGEDVQVELYEPDGVHTGWSMSGTWTKGLHVVEAGHGAGPEIWRARDLVPNAANTYGMTVFAASLNEVTKIEEGKLPPTDSRLRPDQRLAEQGDLDGAEVVKVRLEEAQRTRRRILQENGQEHQPRWFVKTGMGPDGDEIWKLKGGKEGYWEERAKGSWSGVEDIFGQ